MSTVERIERMDNGIALNTDKLDPFWGDMLSDRMERTFPDVIGHGELVRSWKQDGWNDGTSTIYGVYLVDGVYNLCTFPDYQKPSCIKVVPHFEHAGWSPA